MLAGAVGFSSGLYYAPGSYSETAEVISLAQVAAGFNGVYDTHLRDESNYNIGLLAAVAEAITIGREAGIAVHISHIKALGKAVWGQSARLIELIEQARAEGIEVTANQYPWLASGTRFSSALVPRWVQADSEEATIQRLLDPALRGRIHREMQANLERRGGPDALLITDAEFPFRGKTLLEMAREENMSPVEAAIQAVINGDPSIASFVMDLDDINAFAQQDWVMTGSDGGDGHPRKYATYPKAYQDFVIERQLMNTARFVHRSSGLVADSFGLCDRGYLREGRKADIAILDTARFRPQAGYEQPTLRSTGVVFLLVNGELVISKNASTGSMPGVVINKAALRCS